MDNAAPLRLLAVSLLDSFGAQLEAVSASVVDTFLLLEQLRREQQAAVQLLRETLARGRSLRRSDFDQLAAAHFERLEAGEREVRQRLERFLCRHRAAVCELRGALDQLDAGRVAQVGQECAAESRQLAVAVADFQAEHLAFLERLRALQREPAGLNWRVLKNAFAVPAATHRAAA